MNNISFALYGKDPKYVEGLYRNIDLAEEYYPGWRVVVFLDTFTTDPAVRRRLQSMGVGVIEGHVNGPPAMKRGARVLAILADDPDACIFRDTDSRINPREAAAVADWLASDKTMHVMRDHEHHCCHPISAGMWGLKRTDKLPRLLDDFLEWEHWEGTFHLWDDTHTDEAFLFWHVWRALEDDVMQHCHPIRCAVAYERFAGCQPFPPHQPYAGFVGEVIQCEN